MKKNETILLALQALWKSTQENKKKKSDEGRGAPISAVIFNPETGDILSSATNKRTENRKSDTTTHAEKTCLETYIKPIYDETIMIVTLNPCPKCLKLIKKDNKIKKVYFLKRSEKNPTFDKEIQLIHFVAKTSKQRALINLIVNNFDDWEKYKDENPIDKNGNLIDPIHEEVKRYYEEKENTF